MIDRIKSAFDLPQCAAQGNGSGTAGVCTPVEFVELSPIARRLLPEPGETSTNSTPGYNQRAIYPEDSILADWMRIAREQVESADAFIIGSILPVCAALIGRRVYFQWGEQQIFPNCFNMLAGKPGDRKSSIIDLAEMLARRVLPESAFFPKSFRSTRNL